jgi:hypothetical protein
MTCRTERNWESQRLAKIAGRLNGRFALIKVIPLPHMRNVVHNLSIPVRDDNRECH